jgi:hypothetical protein
MNNDAMDMLPVEDIRLVKPMNLDESGELARATSHCRL